MTSARPNEAGLNDFVISIVQENRMPWGRVISFTDPFPYQAAIHAANLEILPTGKGEFYAELTQLRMNQLWIQRFQQRLPQISVGAVIRGRKVFSFLADANSSALQHCGMDVLPGDIIVNNFDVFHQRLESNLLYGAMSLTPDDFDGACKAITGHKFLGSPHKHLVRPNPALMSRLLKLHEMLGRIAKTAPDILELPEVVRALEHELIHVMVRCLTDGTSFQMAEGNRRHDVIVARFEGFLEANADRALYLTEICAAIGVAERTLRTACEEYLGMGPIRYLNLRRMHLVRRALLRAEPSTATVTRVATDHGFWELGRFAVAYRTMFGETPSASLRRPSDDARPLLSRPSSLEKNIRRS